MKSPCYITCVKTIYGPMIYTDPYVMLLMWANPLRGQVGGGWALEIETFWALWNGIEAIGECHLGPKKVEIPRALSMEPTRYKMAKIEEIKNLTLQNKKYKDAISCNSLRFSLIWLVLTLWLVSIITNVAWHCGAAFSKVSCMYESTHLTLVELSDSHIFFF